MITQYTRCTYNIIPSAILYVLSDDVRDCQGRHALITDAIQESKLIKHAESKWLLFQGESRFQIAYCSVGNQKSADLPEFLYPLPSQSWNF